MHVQDRSTVDTIQATSAQVFDMLKNLVNAGNSRKVTIKRDGATVAEFPLTIGVVGAAIAPAVAVLGGIVALATHCTIRVERVASAESSEG
jgi:hypothetical protein